MRQQNISTSLHLPDKTLQFVRDHPLLEDPVLPIGNGPRLITKDVNYTQIVVERVRALDRNIYDVIFTGTGERKPRKDVFIQFTCRYFHLQLKKWDLSLVVTRS